MNAVAPLRALGKKTASHSTRVPRLSAIATAVQPPAAVNWYAEIGSWPMLANDRLGCCVEAAALHCLQQRYGYRGQRLLPTDEQVVTLYSRWAGYNPSVAASDQGTSMLWAMQNWLQTGIPLLNTLSTTADPGQPVVSGGFDKLTAFASIEKASLDWVKFAIWKTGSALVGIHCPEAFLNSDYLLNIPDGIGPIAGDHCILLTGYEPTALGDEFDTITWGSRFRITDRALAALMDEGYAVLDRDWFTTQDLDPAGLNFTLAEACMENLSRIG